MDRLLDQLTTLPALAWCSATFAAFAVLGWVRAPADRLTLAVADRDRRVRDGPSGPQGPDASPEDSSPLLAPGRSGRRRAWWAGHPEGPSLGRRIGLGVLAGGGLCLAASSRGLGLGGWVWLACPVLAAAVAAVLGRVEPAGVRARRERLVVDAPQALELIAACLAAGMPVRSAARAVAQAFDGPLAEDLGRALAGMDLGMAEVEAWRSLAAHPQLGPAAQDLARSVESGTLMVEALQRHADRARESRSSALVVRARSVGVRSVLPLMTCFIPSFLLLGVVPTVVSALTAALG